MTKSHIIVVAAIFAASITSAAFAQSYDNTGSVLPYHYEGGKKIWRSWGPQATEPSRRLEMRPNGDATTPSGGRSSRATDNRNRLWISLAGNNYVQPVSLKVKAGSDNRGLLPASDSSQRIGDRNADARSDIARKIVETIAVGGGFS